MDREPYLRRARACSKLTIPNLIPPDSLANGQALPTPYQSVGASGVTSLASKLLMSMLPPNEPCFRLRIDNMEFERAQEEFDKDFNASIDKALSRIEQAVIGDIEGKGDRPVVYEGNQHLLVGGNVLYHDDEEQGLRMIPLSRFVLDRAPNGEVVEIVVKERINIYTLPKATQEAIREAVGEEDKAKEAELGRDALGESSIAVGGHNWETRKTEDKEVDLFTRIALEDDNRWHVFQEVKGIVIEGSDGIYKKNESPWIPVRMYHVAGENYGRSYVEQYLGDLKSLESLSQAILEATAMSAKVVFLVNPNSMTSISELSECSNGAVISGSEQDVSVLQVQKQADLEVAYQQVQELTNRLKNAFLMVESVQRQAERVTAEEIRMMAKELESGLGGVYTVVSQEFQLPFITQRMKVLTDKGKLPKLPEGIIKPTIVTGFEALGRGNDKQKLIEFLSTLANTLGETAFQYINVNNAISRLSASMGITIEGLVKDEEQMMQEQQQAMQAQQDQLFADAAKASAPQLARIAGEKMLGGSGGGGGGEAPNG